MKRSVARLLKRIYLTGQAMVEFAMATTIFLLLMFAIVELGMVVYSYNTISHAARECVRYAIVHSPTGPAPATTAQIKTATITYADLPAPNQLVPGDVAVTWPPIPICHCPKMRNAPSP